MLDDPIVAEVRKARREILESYGGDFEKMCRDVMERQKQYGSRVVSREKKVLQPGVAPNIYPFRKQP